MSEEKKIEQIIRDSGYAATSGTGNASIKIINYYYGEAEKVAPVSNRVIDQDIPCPYQGLYHFDFKNAEYFFGREVFVGQLLKAIQSRNFIPVLGASGSGKSSVVLAGLVPRLQQQGHWQFTHFRPGSDPFHALALALVPLYAPELDATDRIAQARKLANYLQDGTTPLTDIFAQIKHNHSLDRILLIADQFEELYTLCPEKEVRHRFLDVLLANFAEPNSQGSSPVLVATMRADFLGSALAYRPFADLLQDGDLKLGAMSREELALAIEKPAEKLGVRFADGLVKRILDDVEDEPGNLPLLEFALTELWAKRRGQELTHVAYAEIGEVQGALTTYADGKFQKLSLVNQKQLQQVFVQLVRPGEGAEDTRRLALKSELGDVSWDLVKSLADARLVVTSRNAEGMETVEVVHEALIKNWGELQGWMEADREFRSWQERLRSGMRQWQEAQKDEGALLRGAPLAVAESWLDKRAGELSAPEREFIWESVRLRDRQKKEQERLRQRITLGLSAGLVGALGLAGFAGWQWRQAEITKTEVMARSAQILSSQGKGLDALMESLRAIVLVRNLKANPSPELIGALEIAVSGLRERNRLETLTGSVNSVNFSPDGKTLASGNELCLFYINDGAISVPDDICDIKLWDVATGKEIHTLSGHINGAHSVIFSPDGKTLASGSGDKTIKLWDVSTGKEIRTLQGHILGVNSVNFSPDGKTLASGSGDKTIKLWDVSTGKEIRTLSGHTDGAHSVNFSPDGKTLASGSEDKTIKLWDVSTGKETRTLQGHILGVNSVNFSPDGKTLVSGSEDKTIKLWDVSTGKEIRTLQGHILGVNSVGFSRDGKTLASGSWDKTIKLWDVATGKEMSTLQGHNYSVQSISFSHDGKTLASGSEDKTIKLWDVTTGKEISTLQGHNYSVQSVSFSHDGKTLASGSYDKTIKLWDVSTGKELRTLQGHILGVNSVSFSPNGKTLASGSYDHSIKLWDVSTGKELRTLQGHTLGVNSVSFSPNGKTLASGSYDHSIKLWDVATGQELRTLQGHSYPVYNVNFSPDGKILASGSDDRSIKLWDVNTGREIRTLQGHPYEVFSLSFSPNSKTLASGGRGETIKLWDVVTGKEINTLEGHNEVVFSVSFSPDGKTLASSGGDKIIKLWDVATGKERLTLRRHDSSLKYASFSPNGKTLASSDDNGNVILWRGNFDDSQLWSVDFDDLLVSGCNKISAYLRNPSAKLSDSDRHLCDGISQGK